MVISKDIALEAFRPSLQPTHPTMSLPSQSTRFRLSSSPPHLESIVEKYALDKQAHGSNVTITPDVDSSVMTSSIPRPSLHRTSKPLHSILKRKAPMTETLSVELEHRFEISVIRYRTSCCKSIVCLEQISDWIHETNVHHCPSCMLLCILDPLSAAPVPLQSQSVTLGFRFDHIFSIVCALFQQRHSKINCASPTLPSDSTCRLFDTDDETYPEFEFTRVLSSSLFTTDMKETSARLLNIVGLTLLLLALLPQ